MIKTFVFFGGIAAAIVTVDHYKGPVFPDSLYCELNVGTTVKQGGGTRLSKRTMIDNGGQGPIRRQDHYATDPSTTLCRHGTLWDAWGKQVTSAPRP
jgi:hypothetical protein